MSNKARNKKPLRLTASLLLIIIIAISIGSYESNKIDNNDDSNIYSMLSEPKYYGEDGKGRLFKITSSQVSNINDNLVKITNVLIDLNMDQNSDISINIANAFYNIAKNTIKSDDIAKLIWLHIDEKYKLNISNIDINLMKKYIKGQELTATNQKFFISADNIYINDLKEIKLKGNIHIKLKNIGL